MQTILAWRQAPKSRKSPRTRVANAKLRPREHLTQDEVDRLIAGAKRCSRNPHRDATIILCAYRHALRVSELVDLTWQQFDLEAGELYVRRIKGSKSTTHPVEGDEIRALRKLRRASPNARYVFLSERRGPMSADSVQYLIRRAGEAAAFDFPVHPHMLRHGTGYYLVNKGYNTRLIQEYLGHRNIRHTERYTSIDTERFRGLWHR